MAARLIPANEQEILELNQNARRIVQYLVSTSPEQKITINFDDYNIVALAGELLGNQYIWEQNIEGTEYSVRVEQNTYENPYPEKSLLYNIVQDEEPVTEAEGT